MMRKRYPTREELRAADDAIAKAWAVLYPILSAADMDWIGAAEVGNRLEVVGVQLKRTREALSSLQTERAAA